MAFLQYAQSCDQIQFGIHREVPPGARMMKKHRPYPLVFTFYKGNGNFLRKREAGGISDNEYKLYSQKNLGSNPDSASSSFMTLGKRAFISSSVEWV